LLKKTLNASFADTAAKKDNYAANPRDYFVPDFGKDEDMKNVESAIGDTEKSLGKTMHASFGATDAAVNPRNYFVPDFGVDQDIINVTTSIKNTEKKLNKQFTADFGATAASVNPRDYKVPSYGVD
jgi:hypothetical protein